MRNIGKIIQYFVKDQRCIAEAIFTPPEPAEALRRAFKRYGLIITSKPNEQIFI
jgi:hypothetical protein